MAQQLSNLVVGSKGFIGKSLMNSLSPNSVLGIPSRGELRNLLSTKKILEFENVFWLAGSVSPSDQRLNSAFDHPDFLWLKRFLSSDRMNIYRLIYFSSGGCTYAPSFQPLTEISERKPLNFYGEVKLACEDLLVRHSEQLNTGIVRIILRIANVFGINQGIGTPYGVVAHWMNQYKLNLPLLVYGVRDSYRDYVNVLDVVEASKLSLKLVKSTELNIGSGSKLFLSELLSLFKSIVGDDYPVQHLPRREFDSPGYCLNIKKAQTLLSWNPYFSSNSDIIRVFHENLSENL